MEILKKKGKRNLGSAKKKEYMFNYLGLLPFFILFTVFMLYPFFYGVVMSFTDWSVSSREGINFVGLANYQFILSGEGVSSERFLTSLKNLCIYVPITLLIGMTTALLLALFVNQLKRRSYGIFRGIFFTFIPFALVPIILSLFPVAFLTDLLNSSAFGGLFYNSNFIVGCISGVI